MGVEQSRDDRIVAEFGDGHDVDGIAARYGITAAEVYAVVEREVGPVGEVPPGRYGQPAPYPPPYYAPPPPPGYYAPPPAYHQPPPGYPAPPGVHGFAGPGTLAAGLAQWTDAEGAQFLLGQVLGLFAGRTFAEVRHVFWTDNPLGNELRGMLLALVRAGVLEWREGPANQFRWRAQQ
ncbi:hypothetical protein ACTI_61910 [Actinoplanes sp. OR16]|uniref:hypothetical protein n=1 Tax=Actinoplanes sp. OR16 TaxID=946334 RepID=UPI000F720832|nr:hypothetical protein [Actinoplanes sp. OR16]BBH69506.1 hypothetical protein ACTI_61910 [Actinoplanes sp. OR16]